MGSPWGQASLDDLSAFVQNYWNRWDIESREDGEVRVLVLGPDAAAVRMASDLAVVDTAGEHRQYRWDQRAVMIREDGKWKLLVANNYSRRTDIE
jgi:hypothetical protein